MNWIRLFFVFALVMSEYLSQLKAQDACKANKLSIEAEILYRQKKDLDKAIELYKASFVLNLTDGSKVLDALNTATMAKDTLNAIHFICLGLSIGISANSIKNLWPHLGYGMNFNQLISSIDTAEITKKYLTELDTVLVNQLTVMETRDQRFRSQEPYLGKQQRSLDSINWVQLVQLVNNLGRLPNYKEIGFDGQENLHILFYHMDKEIIEWFLPHIVKSKTEDNSNIGRIILYQLDRIGMSEGLVYTISDDLNIVVAAKRTKMKNGYYCQSFGEWFDESSSLDNLTYETPIDPCISQDHINRVRSLFCLSTIEQRRLTRPWVKTVSIKEFEFLIE